MKNRRIAIILFVVTLLLCGCCSKMDIPTEPTESSEEIYRTYRVDGLDYRETRITIGDHEYFGLELFSCSMPITEGALEIPDEVQGTPVIAIGDQIFQGQTTLTNSQENWLPSF